MNQINKGIVKMSFQDLQEALQSGKLSAIEVLRAYQAKVSYFLFVLKYIFPHIHLYDSPSPSACLFVFCLYMCVSLLPASLLLHFLSSVCLYLYSLCVSVSVCLYLYSPCVSVCLSLSLFSLCLCLCLSVFFSSLSLPLALSLSLSLLLARSLSLYLSISISISLVISSSRSL